MVRLGPDAASALGRSHVLPMDFTGLPMKGMVFVELAGLHAAALRDWVHAAAYVRRCRPSPPPRLPASAGYGTGHGLARAPGGLGPRHAHLAVNAAFTWCQLAWARERYGL